VATTTRNRTTRNVPLWIGAEDG